MHHPATLALLWNLLAALRSVLRTCANLVVENLAQRQQLANLRRASGRPRLRKDDRAFWLVQLYPVWVG
jgi:hypothetical protein